MSDPVRIVRLRVRPARVECEVQLAPTALHRTTPALATRACTAFPDLPHHACANAVGPTFATVMNDTPLPHLLEHLAISLQVRVVAMKGAALAEGAAPVKEDVSDGAAASVVECADSAREAGAGESVGIGTGATRGVDAALLDETFVGTSEWIDEPAGRALIQLSFTDDLIALRALNQAVSALNTLLLS